MKTIFDELQKIAEDIEFNNGRPWDIRYINQIFEIKKLQFEILKCLDEKIKVDRTPLADPRELMKWIDVEKEKPELEKRCLLKTIYDNKVDIEIGRYSNTGTNKYPTYEWESSCCNKIEDVKYWMYLNELMETK